jgi:hypothetical protein
MVTARVGSQEEDMQDERRDVEEKKWSGVVVLSSEKQTALKHALLSRLALDYRIKV